MARCLRCRKEYQIGQCSTSSLNKHLGLGSHKKVLCPKLLQDEAIARGDQVSEAFPFSQKSLIDGLTRLVIENELPLRFGETRGMQTFAKQRMDSTATPVTYGIIKRHAVKDYFEIKKQLREYFKVYDGKISFTTDGWTDRLRNSYICLTAHWINEN